MLPFVRRSLPVPSWVLALGVVLVLASALLLPRLGAAGLWEPQERQFADRASPPKSLEGTGTRNLEPPPEMECMRTQPEGATARTLSTRAARWGRDGEDSDAGRRWPFALMGLVTVLAAAGIAMRLAGARAGVLTGIVLLSMPLLILQSRMLTSDIGTACGATLLLYGLVALSRVGNSANLPLALLDTAVAGGALLVGRSLGFQGGGLLLGVIVPLGAFSAAAGLGIPALIAAWRRDRVVSHLPGLGTTVITIALLCVLGYQLFELRDVARLVDPDDPSPMGRGPARALFGSAILAEGCWSTALGGVWNPTDDVRIVFDSTFEQIAYGTFPWGVLAPIAMIALIRSSHRDLRTAGALAIAWAAAAWIATEVFHRKVTFTIYAGFPALAIAVGVWLDAILARRRERADDPAVHVGMRLVALFFLLAVLTFGLDIRAFPDRMTSLLIGGEQLGYPKTSKLLFAPTKVWPALFGVLCALPFVLSLVAWRDHDHPRWRSLQRFCTWAFAAAMAMSVASAAFWAFAWHPKLSESLSSKGMFETYRELRQPGDDLVIMGDLGEAPRAYSDTKPEHVQSRDQVVKALGRPNRVFAIAPQTELCTLHREIGGKPYYVVDDRNVRSLLLSNKLDGTTDKNPLATSILHDEPKNIAKRPKGRVVWERKIELLGWSIPTRMTRGDKVRVTLFYKILEPVGGTWKSLMHFDGPLRFNGDHDPINGRCPTSTWQQGDYIIDTHVINAGGGAAPSARYDLWIGFFTGSNPNFRNMTLSEAPPDMRDEHNRVKIESIALE